MTLAFVLFNYFPHGGLQRDFLRILQACRARGAEVSVFAMDWQGERPAGVELTLFPGKYGSAVRRRYQFVDFVRRSTANGQFTAVVGFNRMPGLDYYFAADSCFAEKAVNQRPWWYRLTPRCRQYLDFEEAVFAATGTTCSLMISAQQQRQYLKHYFNAARRMISLPPGISEDRRAGADAPRQRGVFRDEFGLSDTDIAVIQIGSGFAVKGVDRSLAAIAALPQGCRDRVRYILIGDDKAAVYLKQARRLGISRQVSILPGRDDIPACLQGADIMLHPAYSESAGQVLVEAVVAGLPVLVTDTCGFAEHVERSGCGRVCPSPFRQAQLNRMLLQMIETEERPNWRRAGIQYGQKHDLYHMQDKVAGILCRDRQADE